MAGSKIKEVVRGDTNHGSGSASWRHEPRLQEVVRGDTNHGYRY